MKKTIFCAVLVVILLFSCAGYSQELSSESTMGQGGQLTVQAAEEIDPQLSEGGPQAGDVESTVPGVSETQPSGSPSQEEAEAPSPDVPSPREPETPAPETPAGETPSVRDATPPMNNRPLPERKDPFVAGVLSWFMMGIGQIYCKEYTKGSLFIAADLLGKVSLILLVSHINNKYAPETGSATLNWASFDSGTKTLIISYLAVSLGLRFYSVVDAVQSAHKYNERTFALQERSGLSFTFDSDQLSLSYSIPLNN